MIKKLVSIFIILTILVLNFSVFACANSAQKWWAGTDASGVVVTEANSPIIVKNEVLSFNIESFPESNYRTHEEFNNYNSSVTAQYTFYNSSNYTVTAKLLFPFGERPMYIFNDFDNNTGTYYYADDTANYEITLNGVPVEKRLRYTLNSGDFDVNRDLKKIREGYTEDSFYYPEMPVKKYTFLASSIDTENDNAASIGFDLPEFNGKTKYYFVQQSGMHRQNNGNHRHSAGVKSGEKFTVYVIGDISVEFPIWTIYKNGGVKDNEEIAGTVSIISEDEITFSDLVFSQYDENYNIPENDWYNAVVENFNNSEDASGAVTGGEALLFIKDDLLRWYEYEISIAPEGEVINTVNAPIYPEINENYSPSVYDYLYLLSPAETWADFGSLDIIINTPYYLIESGNFAFIETDSGYEINLDALPDEELSFRLSTTEHPVKPKKHITDILPVEIIVMLSIIAAATVIIITAIVFIGKKRKTVYN